MGFEQERLETAVSQICGAAPDWEGEVWILQDGIPRILVICFILLSLIFLFFYLRYGFRVFEKKNRMEMILFSIFTWIVGNHCIFFLAYTVTSFGSDAYLANVKEYRSCPAKVMNKWDKAKTIEENINKIKPEISGEVK